MAADFDAHTKYRVRASHAFLDRRATHFGFALLAWRRGTFRHGPKHEGIGGQGRRHTHGDRFAGACVLSPSGILAQECSLDGPRPSQISYGLAPPDREPSDPRRNLTKVPEQNIRGLTANTPWLTRVRRRCLSVR